MGDLKWRKILEEISQQKWAQIEVCFVLAHFWRRFSFNGSEGDALGALECSDWENTMRICIRIMTTATNVAQMVNTSHEGRTENHSKNLMLPNTIKHDQERSTCSHQRKILCKWKRGRSGKRRWICFTQFACKEKEVYLTIKDFFGRPMSWHSLSPNLSFTRCCSNKASY